MDDALDFLPRIPPGVVVERHNSLYLLLHPDAPRWTATNATGVAAARLCDGRHTAGEIAAALAGQWGQPVDAVRRDVETFLADLARAGFLEDQRPAPVEKQPGQTQKRWRLHLYVTEECNLRCRHCGVVSDGQVEGQLSTEALRGLVDQAAAGGAEAVAFGGGEPLLRDNMAELVRHAAGKMKAIVATNGTLIDDAAAAALVEAGAIVQVSLDGPTAEVHDSVRGRGAFARAWRGIERLQRAGIGEELALNVTLMKPNVALADEIVALAEERGVAGVRFTPVQRAGQAAARWAELAPTPEEYAGAYRTLFRAQPGNGTVVSPTLLGLELDPPAHGLWCGLGRMLLVDARGDIYPCSLLTESRFRLGNVAQTPLAEALSSEKLAGLVAEVARRQHEIEECRGCAWWHFCQAGCAGSVLLERGTWHATDELCDLRRELYRERIAGQAEARALRADPRVEPAC